MPTQVRWSSIIMFVQAGFAVALGLFLLFLAPGTGGAAASRAAFIGVVALVSAPINVWLAVMLRRRRNWAYNTNLGLYVLALGNNLTSFSTASAFDLVTSVLGTALTSTVLVLLFHPATRPWFRRA